MGQADITNAKAGDHFSFIFKNEEQLFSVIIPFFIKGLEENQKCMYFYNEISKKKIIDIFKKNGVDILRYMKSGQFQVFACEDIYLKDGYFDPDRTIDLLKKSEEIALKEGYSGLRITGEASLILTKAKGIERFLEYESRLCNFFPGSKVIAICQYDEKKIPPKLLAESIHCHPELIFYDKRCDNLYYSPNLFARKSHSSFPEGTYEIMKEDFIAEKMN